jgi:UDP-3-O-acyl-N-acetylglucosamine deacetylase
MSHPIFGRILAGEKSVLTEAHRRFSEQPVDWDLIPTSSPAPIRKRQATITTPQTVRGPGTFFGKATRTITFQPTEMEGWWFDRVDHPECLPVQVSINNFWTTGAIVSNIVLRSGPPQNYIRLVEHIISLRMGFAVDNLMIQIDSGDPPLFDDGSMPLVEALEKAGRREVDRPVRYTTVKERVTFGTPEGKFLIFDPVAPGRMSLDLDCAVHFPTAIGKQRIRFPANTEHFRYGAIARTNSTYAKKLYCQTIGRLFADVRNLGYTDKNVLIAGKRGYYNEPRLPHEGKHLEAVWHRAVLDLLAAVALIDDARLLGTITSYKAGHGIDCEAIRLLRKNDLLVEVNPG